jgi:hypothetical protein
MRLCVNLILNVRRGKFHKLAWEHQPELGAGRLSESVRDSEEDQGRPELMGAFCKFSAVDNKRVRNDLDKFTF